MDVSLPLLTLLICIPLLGAGLLMFLPKEEKSLARHLAFLVTSLNFLLSLGLLSYNGVKTDEYGALSEVFPTMAMVEQLPWIDSLGVTYLLGVDGISLWLVLLTTFLGPIVVLSTYRAVDVRVKEFMICFLLLMTGMIGALLALDAFLFYVFWELMLIPMYFMIGIWGGSRRHYATLKFFLYTMVGSVLMLISIMYVYFKTAEMGAASFALHDMIAVASEIDPEVRPWLFFSFLLAFAIKVPLFPFHTWLPDAHVQAPTAGSVILAGVLLKMGTYGLMRYGMPLFPMEFVSWAPLVALLSVIGIVYGALVAMVQKDVKKLVAYSSVSHLGFCMLGLAALTTQGVEGSLFVMLAHGVATGGLFLAVGILYERRHTKLIADFGGLTKVVPVFATFFMIMVFTSVGLPGLAGFVGEFLVIMGTAESETLYVTQAGWLFETTGLGPEAGAFAFAAVAATGVIFGAVYLLWMFQRVMFGPLSNPKNEDMKDLSAREVIVFLPLVLLAFVMGIFPGFFMDKMHSSVDVLMGQMKPGIVAKLEAAPKVAPDKSVKVRPATTSTAKRLKKIRKLSPLDVNKIRVRPEDLDKARLERLKEGRAEAVRRRDAAKDAAPSEVQVRPEQVVPNKKLPTAKEIEEAPGKIKPTLRPEQLQIKPGAAVKLREYFKDKNKKPANP